ncbi:MAG TPA: hypothetical protein VH440_01880, partial [Candidatus Limnocylindrales bacterium]
GVAVPVPTVVAPDQPVKVQPDGSVVLADGTVVGGAAANVAAIEPQPFGVRRDTFWPRSLRAWAILSVVFVLVSIQLVSPTRRWRWFRRPARGVA